MAPQAALAVLVLILSLGSPTHGDISLSSLAEAVEELKISLKLLANQVMMQQFHAEEKERTDGDSGIKVQRYSRDGGTKSYNTASHSDISVASIHDHSEEIRTVGMGELSAVLNGNHFRTRHNDYKLKMKSTSSDAYGATEDIPFPDVPPEVTGTVDEQVIEMREWFKAWYTDNTTHRDYRNYFKANLCYLEGQWIIPDNDAIDEPFESDRHHIDANTWLDLQNKVRHTALSGRKDDDENLAYLPSAIFSFYNETKPVMAQWNYRILCHPVSRDIPLNRFRPIEDLKTRLSLDQTLDEYAQSQAARFQINPEDYGVWEDRAFTYGLLDELMSEIPGQDNYHANIKYSTILGYENHVDTVLNLAYYQSDYRKIRKGAMGIKTRKAGFNDNNLYIAMTTQPKVAGLKVKECDVNGANCVYQTRRYSYAIPLEMIYTTPLWGWNPLNLPYRGDALTKEGKVALKAPDGTNTRNGENNPDKAFNGINSKNYYLTPLKFFKDVGSGADKAYVLDDEGAIHAVRTAGPRIFLPEIPGVGSPRMRFPIMPLNVEGSSIWKELEALKDLVLDPHRYHNIYLDNIPVVTANNLTYPEEIRPLSFKMQPSSPNMGSHKHYIYLTKDETVKYLNKKRVDVVTSEAYGHRHSLNIVINEKGDRARLCDGERLCRDGHSRIIERL